MSTGYAAMRNALPRSAGLNILKPSPPNMCLPMAMAKAEPNIAPNIGKPEGRVNARSMPVMAALPSWDVIFWPRISEEDIP